MSEESTKQNFFKTTYQKLIKSIKGLGLFKEFIIVGLIFSIILIAFYDSILPLFIQIEKDYFTNFLSITPLFILIIIFTIAVCSHFKIFGKDTSFAFSHKILKFNKYKKVISRKIEDYKNKIFKIQNLYNQNDLTRVKIKNNIANLTNKNTNLTLMVDKKLNSCTNLNEKNNLLIKKFLDNTKDDIDQLAFKGNQLFTKARAYKQEQYSLAKERMAIDAQNQVAAKLYEENRIKNIQNEQNRRQKAADNERLRRIEIVKQRKLAYVNKMTKAFKQAANDQPVVFFKHASYEICAHQLTNTYWSNWGYRGRSSRASMWCGHDTASAITVPRYAIVDIWEHVNKHGHHRKIYGPQHYNIHWMRANHFNDRISSSHVHINHALLNADIKKLNDKPLIHFGNFFVEGPDGLKAAPGYNQTSK